MADRQPQIEIIREHKFDNWTKDLMSVKPVIEQWQVDQIVADKELGPYRKKYQQLPIHDNGEPLVSCASHGLISKDFYFMKLADGDMNFLPALEKKLFWPFAWLRQTVVQSLKKVDEKLRKHDLFLVVNSGWRHPDVQKLAIEWSRKHHGEKETIRRYATIFETEKGKKLAPHTTGGCCDLELWSLQTGKSLSRLDQKGDEINFFKLEQRNDLAEVELTKRNLRRILYHLLCTPGICLPKEKVFTIHPGEYWHFGYGDPLTAFFNQKPYAFYGYTEPETEFDMYSF